MKLKEIFQRLGASRLENRPAEAGVPVSPVAAYLPVEKIENGVVYNLN